MPRLLTAILRLFYYLLYQPLAWSYDLVAALFSVGRWQRWVQVALTALDAEDAKARILELGHGPGHLLTQLSGELTVGLDRSRQMGRLARRRSPHTPLVRGDGRALPFTASSFTHVIATFPTDYIIEPRTLRGVQRVLQPGGRFVLLPVAWITPRGPVDRLMRQIFALTGQAPREDVDFSGWTRRLTQAGFEVAMERYRVAHSVMLLIVATRR